MYKFKKILNNRFTQDISDKYNSPEVGFWRERLFGFKYFTWSWRNFGNLVLRFIIWLIVFMIIIFLWFAKDLPTPGKIKTTAGGQDVQIFDRNGKQLYAMNGAVKRFDLTSQDIPISVKEATVAAEDHSFYQNIGIDFRGMARAVINDLFVHKGLQGGSTITQQYVKNALLSPQRTFSRKIKEAILSLEIEAMYSKDQILTMYLNQIPYGSNAYGIEAASQTFFGKDAKELDLAQSATLAAIPQMPSYYSPYGSHPTERLARVNYVLNSMVTLKYITKDQAAQAETEAKNMQFSKPHEFITAPHFVMYIRDQLVKQFGEQIVDSGGLKVITTLDLDKQTIAEKAVSDAMPKLNAINATNAALVSLDPKTGQILAMVGSADYFNNDIDGQVNVTTSLRQPGSSFKPVVYATLFQGQYNPSSTLWDVTTNFNNYTPQDYDGSTRGPVSVRTALAGSLNIPAVKALYLAGIDKVLQNAHNMGITSMNDPASYGLSLVLGGAEVKLTDLSTVYGVFANQGKLAPTTAILKVTDGSGKVLEQYDPSQTQKQVIDPQIAYEISSILSDNGARSYVFGSNSALYINGRNVAAKTGTTTDFRDAWTMGYTPSLVTGVWVGNDNNSPMKAGSEGAMAAAPIWHQYMVNALGNSQTENFVQPPGITYMTVDKLSNKLPTKSSPETISDIFASWQVPKTNDDIHQIVRIDKATGNLATADCPDAFTENKIFTNIHSEVPSNPAWEAPVIAMANALGLNTSFPPKQTSCTMGNNDLGVKFANPSNGDTVDSNFGVTITTKSKVKEVNLSVDGQTVGTDSSKPYGFMVKKIAAGSHSLTAVATDSAGKVSSASIKINVSGTANTDTSTSQSAPENSPGNVSNVEITGGQSSAILNWTNPGGSNLSTVNIYVSSTAGDLGNLAGTVKVSPSTNSSTNITGLATGQTYWFTLRGVDNTGNENSDSNQYEVIAL
jgi:1A family penicillin-binding protein